MKDWEAEVLDRVHASGGMTTEELSDLLDIPLPLAFCFALELLERGELDFSLEWVEEAIAALAAAKQARLEGLDARIREVPEARWVVTRSAAMALTRRELQKP